MSSKNIYLIFKGKALIVCMRIVGTDFYSRLTRPKIFCTEVIRVWEQIGHFLQA